MTKLVLDIEDQKLANHLLIIFGRLEGVSISEITSTSDPYDLGIRKENDMDIKHQGNNKKSRQHAIEELRKKKYDSSLIDLNDEKTQYILSK